MRRKSSLQKQRSVHVGVSRVRGEEKLAQAICLGMDIGGCLHRELFIVSGLLKGLKRWTVDLLKFAQALGMGLCNAEGDKRGRN